MIGQADPVHGLYYIHDSIDEFSDCKGKDYFVNTMLNCKEISIDIWHYCLGHPGNKVIEHICNKFPYIQSNFDSVCDICHFSKQHKLPFPHSDTSSLNAFD